MGSFDEANKAPRIDDHRATLDLMARPLFGTRPTMPIDPANKHHDIDYIEFGVVDAE